MGGSLLSVLYIRVLSKPGDRGTKRKEEEQV